MILKRLAVIRLPGIGDRFDIEAESQGIHVIFGPNGIGKSSICRAVESLYWEDRGPSRQTFVTGEFEYRGESWQGEREGSTVRWKCDDAGQRPPSLPPSHNYRCFFLHLRDLIDTSADGTADIALEIQRQISGGFDLDGLVSDLFSNTTRHRKRAERDKFNRASDAVRFAETNQAKLQQRADQLEELQSALDDAEAAVSRHAFVDRATGLAKRREKLAGVEEQLGKLPGALANLTGNEPGDVKRQQEQLTRLEGRNRELETDLENARKARKASRLSAPLEQADLATWRNNADELGRIDQALEAARNDHEKARKRVASALAAIGGGDIDTTGLSLPDHSRLFEFLRTSQVHSAREGAIREKLRLLGGTDSLDEKEQDLERLRAAADALRSWLRLPEPDSLRNRLRRRLLWILSAFALLSTGVVLAFAVDPSLASIAALGVGIGVAALVMGNDANANRLRRAAQATYNDLGQDEPSDWDVASVGFTLRKLEHNTAKLEASLQRERVHRFERESLENELNGMAEQQNSLDAQRHGLQASLELEALQPDAELVDFARALDALRSARQEYEATLGSVQRHETNRNARLEQLARTLEKYGEPLPDSVAATKARLNNLADRNSQLEKALDAERVANGQLEQNSVERTEKLSAISRIFAQAELCDGDLHGLISLLEDLPQYGELDNERKDLASKIDLDRSELEQAGEASLSDMDVQALEALKSNMEDARSQAEDLRQKISDVNALLNQAREGNDLQDLIAAREGARASLQDLRDKALFATAGDFLIAEVEKEYEQTRMPRVFERAREHFSNFTRHNYELKLEKGSGNPSLIAMDLRDRQRRKLDELSDGTRAQLLLAARVAFAEEVEQGEVLPLFLDEALDQSDPQRFEAIVQSLGCIARDQGRQIFYLTSDPLDVDRIRNALGNEDCNIATGIDLGLIRTGAASISGPDALRVAPPRRMPPPDGLTPEEYGAAIAAPAFRPSLGFSKQHIFYVVWDDLNLLHNLLTRGIEWAGQWKLVSDSPRAERPQSQAIDVPEIGFRLDLLQVFCELWNQGRGRPVDRDALIDSDALSSRFLDDVIAIAKELDGDPEQLLALLASRQDDRLRGFQRRTHERLLNYLLENEYLDERPILSEAELRLHALATPAANALPDGVANDCIHRWWGWAEKSSAVETTEQAG